MPFWGVGGDYTSTTPTRSTRSDVSHGGNTTFQTAHSNSLNPGVYLVSVSYTPSDDSGNYPNGDPDHWETRITLDGTQVGDTAFGYESAPRTLYSRFINYCYFLELWCKNNCISVSHNRW